MAWSQKTWLCHVPAVRIWTILSFHISRMTSGFCIHRLGDLSHSCSHANAAQIQTAKPDPFLEFLSPEFKLPQTSLFGIYGPSSLACPVSLLAFLCQPTSLPSHTRVNDPVIHLWAQKKASPHFVSHKSCPVLLNVFSIHSYSPSTLPLL